MNPATHRINGNAASTIDEIGGMLVSAFLADRPVESQSLVVFAREMALPDLKKEHEFGLALAETVAVVSNVPNNQDVTDAFRLLLSLWVRWSSVDSFIRIMQPATVAGRSAIGIFHFLDRLADTPSDEALNLLVRKFIISNENGNAKVSHGSGEIVLLRAE